MLDTRPHELTDVDSVDEAADKLRRLVEELAWQNLLLLANRAFTHGGAHLERYHAFLEHLESQDILPRIEPEPERPGDPVDLDELPRDGDIDTDLRMAPLLQEPTARTAAPRRRSAPRARGRRHRTARRARAPGRPGRRSGADDGDPHDDVTRTSTRSFPT
jgi:hypothetical protein